jgi:hypothetical protein
VFIKIKNPALQKTFFKEGKEAMDWEKMLPSCASAKGRVSGVYKQLSTLNNQKTMKNLRKSKIVKQTFHQRRHKTINEMPVVIIH